MPADWTQPTFVESPGDLGPAILNATLHAVENDRSQRRITLRFALPPDAGATEASFVIEGATHLLSFAYLPPTTPLPQEDALAHVGDWARRGLVASLDLDEHEALQSAADLRRVRREGQHLTAAQGGTDV